MSDILRKKCGDINMAQCLFFANCAYFVKTMTKLTVLKRCDSSYLPRDLRLKSLGSDLNLRRLFQSLHQEL